MRSEFTDPAQAPPPRAASTAERAVRANKAKPRITRSRIAKPLLTSLGTASMLAAGSFVILAVSSTGSARPWDWTRADPAAAVSRYQLCGEQGLGAIGCMLSAGFRPAAAAPAGGASGSSHKALQPLFSVKTVPDPAPSASSGSGQETRASSPRVSTSSTPSGASSSKAGGSQPLVKPSAHPSPEPDDD